MMPNARGYNSKLIKIVNEADQTKLGIRLAQACIKNDISVSEVAEFMGISRISVYNWFKGGGIKKELHEKIEKLITKLDSNP